MSQGCRLVIEQLGQCSTPKCGAGPGSRCGYGQALSFSVQKGISSDKCYFELLGCDIPTLQETLNVLLSRQGLIVSGQVLALGQGCLMMLSHLAGRSLQAE